MRKPDCYIDPLALASLKRGQVRDVIVTHEPGGRQTLPMHADYVDARVFCDDECVTHCPDECGFVAETQRSSSEATDQMEKKKFPCPSGTSFL